MTRALLADGAVDLDERAVAERLCRACVDGLEVDGAALSLLTGTDSRIVLAATDPTAQLLEDLQFSLNEGACVEAAATGRPVLVPDLGESSHTERWPLFAEEVGSRGVAAVFALPLQWGAVNLGVLDLYRRTPGGLEDAQWRDAAAAVESAAVLILGRRTDPLRRNVALRHDTGPGADPTASTNPDTVAAPERGNGGDAWLDQVAGYRAEIYQAVGMVQVQLGMTGTDALARMRGHAFAHHLLLLDVAREVVERRLVFSPETS